MTKRDDENRPQARDKSRQAPKTGRYRLRRPDRFYGRMGLLILIGILVALLIGFLSPEDDVDAPSGGNDSISTNESAQPSTPPPAPIPTATPSPAPAGFQWQDLQVVLDPGHGGRDPGAVSFDGTDLLEKDITLEVALLCRTILEAEGIPVLMTRDSDVALAPTVKADLAARSELANQARATLFVSIHVNSLELDTYGAADVFGLECHYAEKTAWFQGVEDRAFAERVGAQVALATGNKLNAVHHNRLAVVRETEMPAVLLEIGYISNKDDLTRLKDETYLQAVATGLAEAIRATVRQTDPRMRNGTLQVLRQLQETGEEMHE